MSDAVEGHQRTVSTGGRDIANLRFSDNKDDLSAKEEELAR